MSIKNNRMSIVKTQKEKVVGSYEFDEEILKFVLYDTNKNILLYCKLDDSQQCCEDFGIRMKIDETIVGSEIASIDHIQDDGIISIFM
jgi:hypothetical protein